MSLLDTFVTFHIPIPKNEIPNGTHTDIKFNIQDMNATLEIYFNGYQLEHKDFVSIFVGLKNDKLDKNNMCEYSYKLTLINNINKSKNISYTSNVKINAPLKGRYKLINFKSMLTEPGYVNNNKITLRISKFALMGNDDKIIPNDILTNLYSDMLYSDITFRCGNVDVKAHKCILCNVSDVFLKILEKTSHIVCDQNHKAFETIIKFIYTGEYDKNIILNFEKKSIDETNNSNNLEITNPLNSTNLVEANNLTNSCNVYELLELCKMFRLEKFLNEIKKEILFNLDDDNVLIYKQIAQEFELNDLLEKIMLFINANNILLNDSADQIDSEESTDLCNFCSGNYFLCKKSSIVEPICLVY